MTTATTSRFDLKMFQAALAFYGLPPDYPRIFKLHFKTDKAGNPVLDKNGKQVTTLRSCPVAQASLQGNAVWTQVNEPFEGAATFTSQYGATYVQKAQNSDIHFIRNITLDFEYPPAPHIALTVGMKLVNRLIELGIVEPDHPLEDSGAGPHIGIPIISIETTPETAVQWNSAIAAVVKTYIKPEFIQLCEEAGIEMDLGGFDISRVLSLPGTWRPRNPAKADCEALHQGVLRKWADPYTDGNYPVRKESAKLTQLIRDVFEQKNNPSLWLDDYAASHPNSDRSALFQTLVNATYRCFGEDTVKDLKDDINRLSGEKYNGRLDEELRRSLDLAKQTPRQESATPKKETASTFDEISNKLIDTKDDSTLYDFAEIIAFMPMKEQAKLISLIKSKTEKSKTFSIMLFTKLMSEAINAKKDKERAEREALPQYERTDSGMIYNSEVHGEVVLSNFMATIVADTKVDDGVERTRFYELEAELYGRQFSFEVPAKDLDKCGWVDQELGARARVSAGPSIKAHLTNAIKATSEPEEKDQYAHTGWRKIGSRSVFLHTGDCLSQVSQVTIKNNKDLTQTTLFDKSALQALLERERERISQVSQVSQEYIQASVRLTGSLSNYALSCERNNTHQAIKASLGFMDLANDTITVPLYSALWRAVIGNVNFGVHLAGQTGWGKSELCALIQQHFGASMHAKNLPGSWESTVNSLEMLLFQAKDTVVVVDDFKPKGSKADQDRLHANADRVFRQIGNGQGRGRLDSNLGQRAERRPRCLLLSTGEDIPRGQSLKSRGIVLIMSERITAGEASKRLLEAQKDARNGLYAQAMAGYIEWLAPRIEAIQSQLADIAAEEREKLCIDGHARSSDNTANLLLGMKCFLQYAYEMDAITAEEAKAYLLRCKNALIRIAEEASREDREEKQSEQWRKLIESALISKSAYLVGPDGEMPGLEYGWEQSIRVIERDSALENEETFRAKGKQIGWIEGDDIYLNPKAAYEVAKALGPSDLVTLESTLRKFLNQDGVLASTDLDKKRPTITVRRRLQKSQKDVLHIKRQTLFPNDPHVDFSDSLDSLDSEPSKPASEESPDVSQVDDEKASESSSKVDSDSTQIPHEDMSTIPQEHRDLLVRYQKKVLSLKVNTPSWQAPDSGFKNTMFGKKEHIAFTKSLLRSGDLNKTKAALEAMQRTLGEYEEDRRGA